MLQPPRKIIGGYKIGLIKQLIWIPSVPVIPLLSIYVLENSLHIHTRTYKNDQGCVVPNSKNWEQESVNKRIAK